MSLTTCVFNGFMYTMNIPWSFDNCNNKEWSMGNITPVSFSSIETVSCESLQYSIISFCAVFRWFSYSAAERCLISFDLGLLLFDQCYKAWTRKLKLRQFVCWKIYKTDLWKISGYLHKYLVFLEAKGTLLVIKMYGGHMYWFLESIL